MAAIADLLQQITDLKLRKRLEVEIRRLSENKKFGLVFEEHVPECTPLYNVPVRRGRTVAKKNGKISEIYKVLKISGATKTGGANSALADCLNLETSQMVQFPVEELVSVACFGDPIFPSLEPVAKVENAPKDGPWHTIIEADNFHALQLLAYLYPKQVDCIYIDPPYNTGARDWKYNNDYVDASDAWRHSKWLSMMQKRLKLAKKILKPDTGVLIVTIDQNELYHLGLLLEELFPEAKPQLVTICITPSGASGEGLSRVEEYAVFCFMGTAQPSPVTDDLLLPQILEQKKQVAWESMLRRGSYWYRKVRPNLCYPVILNKDGNKIIGVGNPIKLHNNEATDLEEEQKRQRFDSKGNPLAWPVRTDGKLGIWRIDAARLLALLKQSFVYVSSRDEKRDTWTIKYLLSGTVSAVNEGEIIVEGIGSHGEAILTRSSTKKTIAKTMWFRGRHTAGGSGGTNLITEILGRRNAFSFPKSLYSTKDALEIAVGNNPNALVVDFFAGSGTTLHAVNLLNAEDGGSRQCILVTNNEVSEQEAKSLRPEGHNPGDAEWEKRGICRSVTWPRTEYSILGRRADGSFLEGDYYTNQTIEKEESRQFFQLGFIEDGAALSVADKKQILSVLRSKEGKNLLPQTLVKPDSAFIVSDKHTASILFDCSASEEWLEALEEQDHITEFYITTKDNTIFAQLKEKAAELLGPVIVSENIKRPMKDGFAANVEYFKLGFLDRENVSLGRQFREILPLLWLKAGAVGNRPKVPKGQLPDMLILPQNRFAILNDEELSSQFITKLKSEKDVSTVYIVTNSESAYRHIASQVKARRTYQLYRDYIDNFILGVRSDAP
jgi:adenine-specific DNA-methyltransferase